MQLSAILYNVLKTYNPDVGLIEQVYASLKQASNAQNPSNLNNVATSIRQVVLKNDCLEQKNDILDFFFYCEKQINHGTKKQTKKSNKEGKSWIKIIEKNINHIKGLYNLYLKMKNIQLKRGFASLNNKQSQNQEKEEIQSEIDPSSIEVEQDIRLKTLYFFRWCKFIEYGKSIKKLRLKQIDDLRKSLTFNQYAVKFSYFHNWRKISKMSALNKERFNHIQQIQKKSLFNMTMNNFHGLFEIKKIEEKLTKKVNEAILICLKQKVFRKLTKNLSIEKSKQIQSLPLTKFFQQKQLRIQKMRYQSLFYFGQILEAQKLKSKSLSQNVRKSQQNYSNVCAKIAFLCLKNQVLETKENICNLNVSRKGIILQEKFNSFVKRKNVKQNEFVLQNFLEKGKKQRGVQILSLINRCKKTFSNENFETPVGLITQTHKNDFDTNLQEHFQRLNLKKKLHEKITWMKISHFLTKIQACLAQQKSFDKRLNNIIQYRQISIFEALKTNHKICQKRNSHNQFLKSIYHKNILKNAFKSFHNYKQMRLSHQQCLEAIQQKIINPKQITYGFQKILERQLKVESSIKTLNLLEKAKMRTIFEKCFYQHKHVILKLKQMQKMNQLRKYKLLFDMLKKNQQHNVSNEGEIRTNIVDRISKQRFINLFKSQYEHEQKKNQLLYFIKQQKQTEFVERLKEKQQEHILQIEKQLNLSKYLAFSLFKFKFQQSKQSSQILEEKALQIEKYLCLSKLDLFIKSLNNQKNQTLQMENKTSKLQLFLIKNKLNRFTQKILYQQKHNPFSTKEKIKKISASIYFQSFYLKFTHYSKRNYLNRWIDWKKKSLIFQKLEDYHNLNKNKKSLIKSLQTLQLSNAWSRIKSSIQDEKQIILSKQEQLYDFLDHNRRKEVEKSVSKFLSVKQVFECQNRLKGLIKLKYFSKFMRNSLVTKYEKVKQFCAIKSYARNLKQKSWNGLKMMLMRLRDKENRIKTQQQLIVKIDKAMYQSRKTNKLTETIHRFNNSMKNGNLSGIIR